VSETRAPRISPFCRDLRSKPWYFLQGPPKEVSDILDGSNTCWCRRTQMAVGADGDLVHPDECRSDRTCFEPYGSPA
jgi:hypothetical protein